MASCRRLEIGLSSEAFRSAGRFSIGGRLSTCPTWKIFTLRTHFSLAQLIERNRQNNHAADDHLLPIGIGSKQVASVRQQSHDESPHQRPQHAALATA